MRAVLVLALASAATRAMLSSREKLPLRADEWLVMTVRAPSAVAFDGRTRVSAPLPLGGTQRLTQQGWIAPSRH